jgi:hypothetical protein
MGPFSVLLVVVLHSVAVPLVVTAAGLTCGPSGSPTEAYVSLVAGAGTTNSFADGTGAQVQFNELGAVAHPFGEFLYVTDSNNHRIRRIHSKTGASTTVAGSGTPGSQDGTGAAATLNTPGGIHAPNDGFLYFTQGSTGLVRKVNLATAEVSTLSFSGGVSWNFPSSLTSSGGFLFSTSYYDQRVTKLPLDGTSASYLGSGLSCAAQITADPQTGDLYTAEFCGHQIKKIAPDGTTTVVAGSGQPGSVDGAGLSATFNGPAGIARDSAGVFYVAEYNSNVLRMITPDGVATRLAGSTTIKGFANGPASSATFSIPISIAINETENALYLSEIGGTIRRIQCPFPTPSASATATPTATQSRTPTASSASTPTVTTSSTSTTNPTQSASQSATSSSSASASALASSSPPASPSTTASAFPSASATHSATSSPSASSSLTSLVSATSSLSSSPTASSATTVLPTPFSATGTGSATVSTSSSHSSSPTVSSAASSLPFPFSATGTGSGTASSTSSASSSSSLAPASTRTSGSLSPLPPRVPSWLPITLSIPGGGAARLADDVPFLCALRAALAKVAGVHVRDVIVLAVVLPVSGARFPITAAQDSSSCGGGGLHLSSSRRSLLLQAAAPPRLLQGPVAASADVEASVDVSSTNLTSSTPSVSAADAVRAAFRSTLANRALLDALLSSTMIAACTAQGVALASCPNASSAVSLALPSPSPAVAAAPGSPVASGAAATTFLAGGLVGGFVAGLLVAALAAYLRTRKQRGAVSPPSAVLVEGSSSSRKQRGAVSPPSAFLVEGSSSSSGKAGAWSSAAVHPGGRPSGDEFGLNNPIHSHRPVRELFPPVAQRRS